MAPRGRGRSAAPLEPIAAGSSANDEDYGGDVSTRLDDFETALDEMRMSQTTLETKVDALTARFDAFLELYKQDRDNQTRERDVTPTPAQTQGQQQQQLQTPVTMQARRSNHSLTTARDDAAETTTQVETSDTTQNDETQRTTRPRDSPFYTSDWETSWKEQKRRAEHLLQLNSNPQQFGRVAAPASAPGPRMGHMNALVPSAPQAPWDTRQTWTKPDPVYIEWVRMEWEQLVESRQLNQGRLSAKNGLRPLRSGLPQLASVRDQLVRKKLAEI